MPEFDLHVAIERLAEAEWECPDCGGKGFTHNLHNDDGSPIPSGDCPICRGTSCIVPFASLRVSCDYVRPDGTKLIPHHGVWCCGGRRWVPEPDLEKAEYAALRILARYDLERAQGVLSDIGSTDVKGLPIYAALAWVEEQKGHKAAV